MSGTDGLGLSSLEVVRLAATADIALGLDFTSGVAEAQRATASPASAPAATDQQRLAVADGTWRAIIYAAVWDTGSEFFVDVGAAPGGCRCGKTGTRLHTAEPSPQQWGWWLRVYVRLLGDAARLPSLEA